MSKKKSKSKVRPPKEIKKDIAKAKSEAKKEFDEEIKKNPKYKQLLVVLKEGNSLGLRIFLIILDVFVMMYVFVLSFLSIPYIANSLAIKLHITNDSSPAECGVWLMFCIFFLEIILVIGYKLVVFFLKRMKYRFKKRKLADSGKKDLTNKR